MYLEFVLSKENTRNNTKNLLCFTLNVKKNLIKPFDYLSNI